MLFSKKSTEEVLLCRNNREGLPNRKFVILSEAKDLLFAAGA